MNIKERKKRRGCKTIKTGNVLLIRGANSKGDKCPLLFRPMR